MITKNKWFQVSIFFVSVLLVISFCRGIYHLLRSSSRLEASALKLQKLEDENDRLKQERKRRESSDFIEEEARNKLNMAKPGETIVILPKSLQGVVDQKTVPTAEELPNWKRWVSLFFH